MYYYAGLPEYSDKLQELSSLQNRVETYIQINQHLNGDITNFSQFD